MATLEDVVDLAADQWGMVTTAQAANLGVHRHHLASAVDSGRMERIAHGVYAMAGVPDSPMTRLRAAYLGADPAATLAERRRGLPDSGVVSHASAAAVHGLGTLRALRHEMTFPERRQTQRREIKYHMMWIGPESITEVDGLPVTTVERTAADLLRSGIDEDHVSQVLADAVERDMLERQRLVRELEPVAKRRRIDPVAWSAELAPVPDLEGLLTKHYPTLVPSTKALGTADLIRSSTLIPRTTIGAIGSQLAALSPAIYSEKLSDLVPKLDSAALSGLTDALASAARQYPKITGRELLERAPEIGPAMGSVLAVGAGTKAAPTKGVHSRPEEAAIDDPVIRARIVEVGKAARRALEDLADDCGVPVADLVGPMLRAGGLVPSRDHADA